MRLVLLVLCTELPPLKEDIFKLQFLTILSICDNLKTIYVKKFKSYYDIKLSLCFSNTYISSNLQGTRCVCCTLNSRDGIDVVSSGKIVSGDHKSLWHPHPSQQEVTISTAYYTVWVLVIVEGCTVTCFNLSSVFIHVMYWLCLICPISHFTSTSQEVPVPLLVSYVMGARSKTVKFTSCWRRFTIWPFQS